MKTLHRMLLVAALVLATDSVFAKIWTVDNNPGNSAADTSNIPGAIALASSGDTIYVAGSSLDYSATITLAKKLYIFGPGYFLAENIDLQANTAPASITGSMTFSTGSQGSIVQGLTFDNYVYFYTDNITFRRNRTTSYLSFNNSRSNVIFAQNYCTMTTSSNMLTIGTSNTNILISNNFFENASSGNAIYVPNGSNVIITNNIFSSTLSAINLNAATGAFDNNILRNGTFAAASIVHRNNIGNSTQFVSTANGNQLSVSMSTVFVGTGTSDAKWQILAAGPADNAGLSGEDCGMYGGNSPYVLSGMPPIPSIYFMGVPVSGSAAQGLPVTIKAKTHK